MGLKRFFNYLFGKQIVYEPEPELSKPQICLSYQQTNLWDTEENLDYLLEDYLCQRDEINKEITKIYTELQLLNKAKETKQYQDYVRNGFTPVVINNEVRYVPPKG